MNLTVDIVARLAIIDAIAVADIEAVLGAVPPDRVLHEPGKHRRERGIEGAGIDPFGHGFNDLGAAAGPVAGRAIGMVGAEPVQDAGAVQKVVHEGVDGDHAGADLDARAAACSERRAGGRTRPWSAPCRRRRRPRRSGVDDGVPHSGQPVRIGRRVRRLQPLVDPADQIAVGKVANEQVQRIGGLVEVAVAQVMGRQRTAADVIGLGAGPAQLAVAAVVELPVALELGAGGAVARACG